MSYAPGAPAAVWAMPSKVLGPGVKLTLMSLWARADHADQRLYEPCTVWAKALPGEGQAEALVNRTAEATGQTPRAVRQHLTKLRKLDLVCTHGRVAILTPACQRCRESVSLCHCDVDAETSVTDADAFANDTPASVVDTSASLQLTPPVPPSPPKPGEARATPPDCSGIAAVWCPNCGDCTCKRDHGYPRYFPELDEACPLHGEASGHPTPHERTRHEQRRDPDERQQQPGQGSDQGSGGLESRGGEAREATGQVRRGPDAAVSLNANPQLAASLDAHAARRADPPPMRDTRPRDLPDMRTVGAHSPHGAVSRDPRRLSPELWAVIEACGWEQQARAATWCERANESLERVTEPERPATLRKVLEAWSVSTHQGGVLRPKKSEVWDWRGSKWREAVLGGGQPKGKMSGGLVPIDPGPSRYIPLSEARALRAAEEGAA